MPSILFAFATLDEVDQLDMVFDIGFLADMIYMVFEYSY